MNQGELIAYSHSYIYQSEFKPKREAIYHYTTCDALKNIITSEGIRLWASDIRCLNDESEYSEGKAIFDRVAKRRSSAKGKRSSYINLIENIQPDCGRGFYMNNETGRYDITDSSRDHFYICSLSESQDSLAMWNYYSKSGRYEGYSLGFFPYGCSDSLHTLSGTGTSASLNRVIYQDIKKEMIVEKELSFLEAQFDVNRALAPMITTTLARMLNFWNLTFKKECFMHEEEVRIILSTSAPAENKKALNRQVIKYRTKNGLQIPYYEILLKDKRILDSIIIAPYNASEKDKRKQELILMDMINDRNYPRAVKITTSRIPVRY